MENMHEKILDLHKKIQDKCSSHVEESPNVIPYTNNDKEIMSMWLKKRISETRKEYNDIKNSVVTDKLKSKGGKLRAFKEALAFLETH